MNDAPGSPRRLEGYGDTTNIHSVPPGQAGAAERGPDKASKTRWTPEELDQRAKVIASRWSAISGHDVKLTDAARIARLSLPLAAVSKVLRVAWQQKTGLGLAWPALRQAEREYLVYFTPPTGGPMTKQSIPLGYHANRLHGR